MRGKESSGTTGRAIELELLNSTPGLFDDSCPNAIKFGARCSSNSSVNFQRLPKKKEEEGEENAIKARANIITLSHIRPLTTLTKPQG